MYHYFVYYASKINWNDQVSKLRFPACWNKSTGYRPAVNFYGHECLGTTAFKYTFQDHTIYR